jgi:hypothetical protein
MLERTIVHILGHHWSILDAAGHRWFHFCLPVDDYERARYLFPQFTMCCTSYIGIAGVVGFSEKDVRF